MLAACSDSLEETAGNGTGSGGFNGEKGYVNIGLKLPSASGASTRSGSTSNYTEDFKDGTADEYKVSNVIIALFYGQNENSAVCKNAFKLTDTDFQMQGTTTDNVTTFYASGVRMIAAPKEGEYVYALALVNADSQKFDIEGSAQEGEMTGDAVLSTFLKVDGSKINDNTTLASLNEVVDAQTSDLISTENGFFMSNAPYSTVATATYSQSGLSGQNVYTLAPITVYNTKENAEAAAHNNPIYVERAVAKVQVKVNSDDGSLTVKVDAPTAYEGAKVTFDKWILQNTNKKYYPVRKVTDEPIDDWEDWSKYVPVTSISSNSNRFFGSTANPYRTYWGIDPNYTEVNGQVDNNFNIIKQSTANTNIWNAVGNTNTADDKLAIEYCLENTTTSAAMKDNQLTSVLLQGTFKLKDGQENDDLLMINNTSAIYTENQFLAWATDVLNGEDNTKLPNGASLALSSSFTSGKTITTKEDVKSLLTVQNGTPSSLNDAQSQAILTAAGSNIKYYKGGVTYYYATVIKHFGEGAPVEGAFTTYNDADHLGRYGVLRNNWYEITINSVSGPGEPEIPEIPTDPVDKTNSYINAEINVLSWAKRTQGVEL